jgi:hypothetical protein
MVCHWNELLKHMRAIGLIQSRKFTEIRKYKNKHAGQRCFIVCTGPSLTYEDLELLKGEITFSMNGIIKGFNKTDWRPTYYGIQDHFVYEECQELILKDTTLTPFIADWIVKKNRVEKILYNIPSHKIPAKAVLFPISIYKHRIFSRNKRYTKFSANAAALVYDGDTITYSLLQIAVYMGFKEIYLLGCDYHYSSDPKEQHFVEMRPINLSYAIATSGRVQYAYRKAKEYADAHKIRIYNATRNSQLKVFEKVTLETVLS